MSSPKFEFLDFSDTDENEAQELLHLIKEQSHEVCEFSCDTSIVDDLEEIGEDIDSDGSHKDVESEVVLSSVQDEKKLSGMSFFVDGGSAEDIDFEKTPPLPSSGTGTPFPASSAGTPTPSESDPPTAEPEEATTEEPNQLNMYHVPPQTFAPPPMVPPQPPVNVHTMPSMYHMPPSYQNTHAGHTNTMMNGVYPHISHVPPHHPSAPFPPTVHIENCHVNLSPYGNPQHPGTIYNHPSQSFQGSHQVYNPYVMSEQPILVHPKAEHEYKRYDHNRGNYRGRARGRGRRRRDEGERSNSVSSEHSSYSDSGKVQYKDGVPPPPPNYPMMLRYPAYMPYVNPMTRTSHGYMVHHSPYYDPYSAQQHNAGLHYASAQSATTLTMIPNEPPYNHHPHPPHTQPEHNIHSSPHFNSSSLINPADESYQPTTISSPTDYPVDTLSTNEYVNENTVVESYTQITTTVSEINYSISSPSSTIASTMYNKSPAEEFTVPSQDIDICKDVESLSLSTEVNEEPCPVEVQAGTESLPINENSPVDSAESMPNEIVEDVPVSNGPELEPYVNEEQSEQVNQDVQLNKESSEPERPNAVPIDTVVKSKNRRKSSPLNSSLNSGNSITIYNKTHVQENRVVTSPEGSSSEEKTILNKTVQNNSKVITNSNKIPKVKEVKSSKSEIIQSTSISIKKEVVSPKLSGSVPPSVKKQEVPVSDDLPKSEPVKLSPVSNSQHAWAQKKSWSNVFKSSDEFATKQVAFVPPFNAKESVEAPSNAHQTGLTNGDVSHDNQVEKIKIGEKLKKFKYESQDFLQPRGLINKNYWCYVNAPLQALLACPSLYELISKLSEDAGGTSSNTSTPFLNSLVDFVSDFSLMSPTTTKRTRKEKASGASKKDVEISHGPPMEPTCVYKMLIDCKENEFTEGRQQDAEELLSCVLNGLHDEMVECLKLVADGSKNDQNSSGGSMDDQDDDGEEWKVQGPKRKSCITRSAHFSTSPISHIFWGQLRSVLQQGGNTTANLQPFNTLPLDIQSPKVETLKDALAQLVSKEEISGFTCPKTNQEITASNQVMLEDLPRVFILQLKRFIYDKDGGLQKVTKRLQFPVDLDLTKDLISVSSRSKYTGTQRKYKLFAVVNHEGKEATKGHYVVDVYHPGYDTWIRYDDAHVKSIPEATVLRHEPPNVPYLLFYRRADTALVSQGNAKAASGSQKG